MKITELEGNVWEINTCDVKTVGIASDLYQGREQICHSISALSKDTDVLIYILAYNRLEKTKQCVESVLRYTSDVNYSLLLIDNGSTDETLSYFKSISFPHKIIWHITHNRGAVLPSLLFSPYELPAYVLGLANDVIVTQNWLSNMLTVAQSDKRIGLVCPVSSNVSNLQQVNLNFNSLEEMQRKAAVFNQSNPNKWQERLRLMTICNLIRKECLLAVGLPFGDVGFFHDFSDDDFTFRIRRMGYKIILAGDTWVHHNHDIWHQEGKNPEDFRKSLEIGRQNFMDKYHGVDAWEDVNNFWMGDITSHIPCPGTKEKKQILGVDVRCGTPILDVKNRLRELGIYDIELSAFTQVAKYVPDLQTICTGIVACDREEFFARQFPQNYYDYIVVDQPINRYHEPQQMLEDWFSLLKPGGILIFSQLNTFSYREYLYCQGQCHLYNRQFAYNIPCEAVQAALNQFGIVKFTVARQIRLSQSDQDLILKQLPKNMDGTTQKNMLQKLLVDKYFWAVVKFDQFS